MDNPELSIKDDILNAPARRPPLRKRFLFRLLTVMLGVVFGLVIVEAGLRIVGYSSPEFYEADHLLGYRLIPEMSGWYRKEGRSFVTINSDSFRDVEHAAEKPAGTVRIAIIGDSYVEALQVSQDEMFSNFFRSTVLRCGVFGNKKEVEILNFGVSGYNTAQELLMLRERVWKYAPDVVMLVMTTNNDISDNSRYFKRTAIPYFVFTDDILSLDNSFRHDKSFVLRTSVLGRLGSWLKQNLRVVQGIGEMQVAFKYWYQAWKNRPSAGTNTGAEANTAPIAEVGIDNQVYRQPVDANWENAWRVAEGIIMLMRAETEARGAKFVVVTASNGVQVLPVPEQRTAFAKKLVVDDLFYPDRRIAEFCRSHSIPVITLAPELGDYAERNNLFLHGFEGNMGSGHWNQTGHRIAGEMIGKHVCEVIPQ